MNFDLPELVLQVASKLASVIMPVTSLQPGFSESTSSSTSSGLSSSSSPSPSSAAAPHDPRTLFQVKVLSLFLMHFVFAEPSGSDPSSQVRTQVSTTHSMLPPTTPSRASHFCHLPSFHVSITYFCH